MDEYWYVIVIFVYISLISNEIDYVYVHLLAIQICFISGKYSKICIHF